MIGQTGTGSPEVGTVRLAFFPVFMFTPCGPGRDGESRRSGASPGVDCFPQSFFSTRTFFLLSLIRLLFVFFVFLFVVADVRFAPHGTGPSPLMSWFGAAMLQTFC